MKDLKLLALTGRPGVGKDSCAAVLQQQRGFQSIAFADALRKEVAAAWRIDERMLSHRPTKEWPIPALAAGMCCEPEFLAWCRHTDICLQAPRSPRWAMQNWASWRRHADADYFVKIVAKWMDRQIGLGAVKIVVTDLRFANEQAMLLQRGAQIIRVQRPDIDDLPDDTAAHESEQGYAAIEAHAEIVNDGSLEALAEAVLSCSMIYTLADYAREYSIRCETFDRQVCSGPIGKDGCILPATEEERRLITHHANNLLQDIARSAQASRAELCQAIRAYERSYQSRIDLQAICFPAARMPQQEVLP